MCVELRAPGIQVQAGVQRDGLGGVPNSQGRRWREGARERVLCRRHGERAGDHRPDGEGARHYNRAIVYGESVYRPCCSSSSPRSRQDKDIFKRLQEKAKENMDSSPDMPMDEVRAGTKLGGGRGGSAVRPYLYRAPRKG